MIQELPSGVLRITVLDFGEMAYFSEVEGRSALRILAMMQQFMTLVVARQAAGSPVHDLNALELAAAGLEEEELNFLLFEAGLRVRPFKKAKPSMQVLIDGKCFDLSGCEDG